jgi:hypothetical protein
VKYVGHSFLTLVTIIFSYFAADASAASIVVLGVNGGSETEHPAGWSERGNAGLNRPDANSIDSGTGAFAGPAESLGFTQIRFSDLLATNPSTLLDFGLRTDPSFWLVGDIIAGLRAAGVCDLFSTIWLTLPVAAMVTFRALRTKIA